MATESKCFC